MKRKGCCNACGAILRPKHEMVYRHTPREMLCVVCAQIRGAYRLARPSLAWEEAHSRRRARRKPIPRLGSLPVPKDSAAAEGKGVPSEHLGRRCT